MLNMVANSLFDSLETDPSTGKVQKFFRRTNYNSKSNINGVPVKPKDYLATVIVLSNLNPYFAAGIGESRLKAYRNIQQELINESQDEQAEKVFEEVVIDWSRILEAFDDEKKKFRELDQPPAGKQLPVKDKNFVTDFILLALPILLDPKRDDFAEIKVLEKGNSHVKTKGNRKNKNLKLKSS